MDAEDEEPFLNRSYRRLAGRVRIPGFRPGKAPRSVVESHLGRATLVQEALEFMIPESLDQVLREHEIRAFVEPQLEVLELEPVSFKAVVPLEPEVDLGELGSLSASAPPVEIGDEDVTRVLENLRYESAPWEPVERPVAFGDLVTMNVRGTVAGEDAIDDEGVDFIPQVDNNLPVPGFSVYLEGMTEGQEKDFTLAVPEDRYQENYSGKECYFHVEVISVKEKQLPELDDEFAKGVMDGFESMEALSDHIRQRLTADGEATAQRELERTVLEELKNLCTIQASELIYQREMESIREDHERNLRNQRLDMETYLRFIGQTAQEFEEQLRPQAEDRLATLLVMRKFAEQENIEIEAAEIDTEIDRLTENSAEETVDSLRRVLSSDDSRESLRSSLLNRKVLARLVEIAVENETSGEPSGDEPESSTEVVDEPEASADEPEATTEEGPAGDSEPDPEGSGDGEPTND
jgi:trigger factor